MTIKFSAIVLNYFGHKDTNICIESLLKELDATVFLVDNSANKEEKDILLGTYLDNPDVKLYFPEENLGFSKGVNFALEESTRDGHDHFIILNSDAYLMPGSGETITEYMKARPGTIFSPLINWGSGIVGEKYYHRYLSLLSDVKPESSGAWLDYITGCALIFDLTTLERIGRLDERFFMYGEDIEFSHRADNKGINRVVLNDVLIMHEGSASAMKASFFYEYHINRGHILLVSALSDNFVQAFAMYAARFFILVAKGSWRSVKYKSLYPLIACIAAWLPLKVRPAREH